MLKKHPFLKWSLIALTSVILLITAFCIWFMSLIPDREDISRIRPKDLPYLSQKMPPTRGKILVVVTSCEAIGDTGKKTGYELTELSRSYYVFKANGYEVDIASPKGGAPPVVIDWDDMGPFDYAFLNDSTAQYLTSHTLPVHEAASVDYDAIIFLGGKGAMFDFPQNKHIQSLVRESAASGKVIGAVCHGPAALINVIQADGRPLLADKNVCSFTNAEELFLIPDAKEQFPFLLEDELVAKGAQFRAGPTYLENVVRDGNLVTGQNPWSTWAFAETIVRQLGHTPVPRETTAEEYTVQILSAYEKQGYARAKTRIDTMLHRRQPIDRNLLRIHGVVAALNGELSKTFDLVRLLAHAQE